MLFETYLTIFDNYIISFYILLVCGVLVLAECVCCPNVCQKTTESYIVATSNLIVYVYALIKACWMKNGKSIGPPLSWVASILLKWVSLLLTLDLL